MTFSKTTQTLINKALEAKAAYEDARFTRRNVEQTHVAYEDAREAAFCAVAEEVGVTL